MKLTVRYQQLFVTFLTRPKKDKIEQSNTVQQDKIEHSNTVQYGFVTFSVIQTKFICLVVTKMNVL